MRTTTTRIRLLSALALLLLLGIIVTGITLIISNPGLMFLYVICALALLTGGWLLLSSHGLKVWWGATLSALAAIGLFGLTWALFFNSTSLGSLLLLTALGVAYSALVSLIARLYWQTQRRANASHVKPVPAALIINPKSGDGRATKAHVAAQAEAQGIKPLVMQPGQNLVALAEGALAGGTRVLGISGGDGSLGALAAVAIKHNVPLVVLPGGTRCHFARDIGLDPEHIVDALAAFKGVERRIDVGMIGERVFLNNASFGLYAEIISNHEYRDHKLEVTTRVTRELASSDRPYYPLKFKAGDRQPWNHAAQVFVGVNRYETLNVLELGERHRLDEGVLHVIAIRSLDSRVLKSLSGNLNLAASDQTDFHQWTAPSFEISHPSGSVSAGIDGESVRLESPVHVQIRPQALRLLVPAEGVRSRPVAPLSLAAAQTLWSLVTTSNSPGDE